MSEAISLGASSVKSFCDRNDICAKTFYTLLAEKKLVARKIGSRTVVLTEDEKAWRDSLPRFDSTAAA